MAVAVDLDQDDEGEEGAGGEVEIASLSLSGQVKTQAGRWSKRAQMPVTSSAPTA